jgi:hypothetical protein
MLLRGVIRARGPAMIAPGAARADWAFDALLIFELGGRAPSSATGRAR